ncbi:uncharacterized protein TNCV_2430921 [Trichonephila clavipes]|nr:uncharacterized protein TNCV_2430921 [Trichonephila clavipes]
MLKFKFQFSNKTVQKNPSNVWMIAQLLFVQKSVRCTGGVCVLQPDEPVKCNTEKGGIVMLAKNPVPHWMCLCTDATFWLGLKCNTLNPDVSEHGVLMYKGRDDYICICPSPYQK